MADNNTPLLESLVYYLNMLYPWRLFRKHRHHKLQSEQMQQQESSAFPGATLVLPPLKSWNERNYVINSSHGLCSMPVELIYVIDDELPAACSLALRATSSRLLSILSKRKQRRRLESVTAEEIRDANEEMRSRLRKDYFNKLCDAERAGRFCSSERLCSSCQELHPHGYFSSEQLRLKPEDRICKGLQGAFRVCRHLILNYNCIKGKKGGPGWNVNKYGNIVCTSPEHQHNGSKFDHGVDLLGPSPTLLYYQHFHRPLYPDTVDTQRPLAFFLGLIAKDETRICPHILIRDLDVLQESYETKDFKMATFVSKSEADGKCKHAGCGAEFELKWKWGISARNKAEWKLVLITKRSFSMRHANDPTWLANIEDPAENSRC